MNPTMPIQSHLLSAEGIEHGFFTREGGISEGIYAGLNVGLGSDDKREHVLENRKRVAERLGVASDALATVHQVHSPHVVEVNTPWTNNNRPQVDAMVTRSPDIALGTLTADCGPVLFCDANNRVIGAAHSGWKGATTGVLENTVAAMEKIGAKREKIIAVLGPTISGNAYEVGPEFVDRLMQLNPANDTFLKPSGSKGHAMFDLPSYIVERLKSSGVKHAEWTGQCTYEKSNLFYSYRRKTHVGEPDYGRQISAITLKPGG